MDKRRHGASPINIIELKPERNIEGGTNRGPEPKAKEEWRAHGRRALAKSAAGRTGVVRMEALLASLNIAIIARPVSALSPSAGCRAARDGPEGSREAKREDRLGSRLSRPLMRIDMPRCPFGESTV
jgi:hypothetical protein